MTESTTKDSEFNETLRKENAYLRTQNQVLTEELNILKKKLFGSSSERQQQNTDQPNLFEDLELIKEVSEETKTISVKAHVKKKGGRKPLSDKLPRVTRVVDFSDEEKHCSSCGQEMEKIGEDISERAEMIPPKVLVEKCIRPRCICRSCNRAPVAKELPYVLANSIAANGLFAHILTSKFCDSLPFHRQEGILSRYGIEYPKANMSNNAIQFHETYGEHIVYLLEKQLFRGNLLQIDETTTQVLGEPNRANKTKSYVWTFRGGGDKPAIVFDYRRTRNPNFLPEMLENYQGTVLTDGYTGYDSVCKGLNLTHAGCNAHARRYFVEAAEAGFKKAKLVLGIYAKLYQIESKAKRNNYSPEELFSIRQEESKPLMRKLRKTVEKIHRNTRRKNTLFKATNYVMNQWPKLTQFLGDGSIPIDNNTTENAIRPYVIGRNNWLFSGSPRGAEAACMYYSLIETAKANGHEPFWYLRRLFDELPFAKNNEDIDSLMPYNMPAQLDSS